MGQEGLGKDWRTFGTHLERGLGRSARGDVWGRRKAQSGSFLFLFFLPDSADVSARRVKGLRKVSSSFCKGVGRMERGGRRGGGSPARGAGVEQPRGWDSGQRALPPGGAPSCCGSVGARAWLEGRPGCRVAQAGLGPAEGRFPSPWQRLELGTPQNVPSS